MAFPSVADVLEAQLRQAWSNAGWLLEGLDDDEYFWEPRAGCWSVRRRTEAERGWGTGEFVCEDAWPPPDPLPLTTIAWRVIHLAAWTEVYRQYTFGVERPNIAQFEIPGSVTEGVAWLRRTQDDFIAAVAALGDDEVFEARPTHWGATLPLYEIVSLMLSEHVHHLAEIGTLRDLRRGHAENRPPPAS